MEDKSYRVYDKEGRPVLAAPLSCRYDKETEKSLIDAGYVVKINGRRVTKKELK